MNRWVVLASLFMARLVMGFQFQSVASVSPYLVGDFGLDYTTIGALVGLYMLPGIVLALPGGMLVKRFGDKRAVACGLLAMTVGGLIAGLGATYGAVWAGRIISGMGVAFLFVSMTRAVTDRFAGRNLAFALAVFMNGWPVGIGVGLVTQARIVTVLGWPAVFILSSVACLVSLLLFLVVFREEPRVLPIAGVRPKIFGLSWRETVLISICGILWATNTGGWLIMISFAPSFFVSTGMTVAEAADIVSINSWISIVTMPLGGYIASLGVWPNLILLLGLGGKGILNLLVPFVAYPVVVFLGMSVVGGLPGGVAMTLPAEVLRRENLATGMGVFYTWFYIGSAALPPIGGWAFDISGDPAAPLIAAALLTLATLPLLWILRLVQGSGRPA